MIIKPAKFKHNLLAIYHDWKQAYPANKNGDIIFQNKALLTNIRFNDSSFHAIEKHSAGFENIPDTLSDPDEVWSSWENATDQKVTLRTYIKFGEMNYLVKTRDGLVVDAFVASNSAANGFRKGLPVFTKSD